MNKTLEKFYLEVLSYAGLKYDNNIIVNVNEKLGDFKIDDKNLTLPYMSNLKNNPGYHIFHPLNENFSSPENTHFNLYRKKLTYELNMRLCTMIISLLKVGSDALVQQRLKSEQAVSLVSALGEVDITTIEYFVSLVKASQAQNNASFIFDIYLKKNGSINDNPHLAIGKINFVMYRELCKALEDKEMGYKVFGCKLRKKDIITLLAVFDAIFPNINNPEDFTIGTDNKVFRYFSALLLTSYPVAYRLNQVASLLEEAKDPSLSLEESVSDMSWTKTIESTYPLTDEIRDIPSQICIKTEANQLKVDESKIKEAAAPIQAPSFVAQTPVQQQPQAMTTAHQPVQVQQQPQQMVPQQQLTAEDIIRGSINPQLAAMQGGMYQPGMQMPQQMYPAQMYPAGQMPQQMMMPVQPGYPVNPGWGGTMSPQAAQMMMQTGLTPQQVMMMQQQAAQTQAVQQQPQGLQLNPHMMGGFR